MVVVVEVAATDTVRIFVADSLCFLRYVMRLPASNPRARAASTPPPPVTARKTSVLAEEVEVSPPGGATGV